MTFDEVVRGLTQLRSFDHSACDAILKARAIDISNAYNPRKVGGEDSVYVGFAVVVAWLVGVAVLTGLYFMRKLDWLYPNRLPGLMLTVFLIVGMVMLCAQLSGMANYAQTCRGLLHL